MSFLPIPRASTTPGRPAAGIYLLYQKGDGSLYFLDDGGNEQQIATVVQTSRLPGEMVDYGGATAPAGWLLCDGSAVSRITFAALFAVIGVAYGTGDGTTTFNLPDRRGRVSVGKDDMGGTPANRITNAHSGIVGTTLGASGGDEKFWQHTHTATVTDPGHGHGITDPGHGHNYVAGDVGTPGNNAKSDNGTTKNNGTTSNPTGITINSNTTGITVANSNAGAGGSENVQPSLINNVIIKT